MASTAAMAPAPLPSLPFHPPPPPMDWIQSLAAAQVPSLVLTPTQTELLSSIHLNSTKAVRPCEMPSRSRLSQLWPHSSFISPSLCWSSLSALCVSVSSTIKQIITIASWVGGFKGRMGLRVLGWEQMSRALPS